MPEEINRVLTDGLAVLLFVTEPSGARNLWREGITKNKVFHVGNTMVDTMLKHREKAAASTVLQRLGLDAVDYDVGKSTSLQELATRDSQVLFARSRMAW